jgi:hypothetical protein
MSHHPATSNRCTALIVIIGEFNNYCPTYFARCFKKYASVVNPPSGILISDSLLHSFFFQRQHAGSTWSVPAVLIIIVTADADADDDRTPTFISTTTSYGPFCRCLIVGNHVGRH